MMGSDSRNDRRAMYHAAISNPRIAWRTKLGERGLGSALVNSRVLCSVVGSDGAKVAAVSRDCGELAWTLLYEVFPACYWSCGAILDDGRLLVSFDHDVARLVSVVDGRIVGEGRMRSGWFATSPPVVVGGNIVVGAGNSVLCLRSGDLSEVWSAFFSVDSVVLSPPVAIGPSCEGFVVQLVNSSGTQVVRLDAESGAEVWRSSLPSIARGTASAADAVVLVTTTGGRRELHALSMEDGTLQWSLSLLDKPPGYGLGDNEVGVAVDSGIVYAVTEHGLSAFAARDGSTVWRRDSVPSNSSAPSIGGGAGYAVSPSGELVAWQLSSGSVQWRLKTGSVLVSPPSLGDATVFLGTENGEIVCVAESVRK